MLTILAGWLPHAEAAVGAMGVCFGLHVIVYFLIAGGPPRLPCTCPLAAGRSC
jgi:hypothetical protein